MKSIDFLKENFKLDKIPFKKDYLNFSCYQEKGNTLENSFEEDFCLEAKNAFKSGLLQDFNIYGLSSKGEIKLKKVGEYIKDLPTNNSYSEAGRMRVTIFYKAIKKDGTFFFITCENDIVFPILIRKVSNDKKYEKIQLFPYVNTVYVNYNNNFNGSMDFKLEERIDFFKGDEYCIDKKLFQDAFFFLETYELLLDRSLMCIDNDTSFSTIPITLNDLKTLNTSGRHTLRSHLQP